MVYPPSVMYAVGHGCGSYNFAVCTMAGRDFGAAVHVSEVGVYPSSVVLTVSHLMVLTISKVYIMAGWDLD